jgi:3'-phosphoadenosine 5'-phosphosulfate sulfotransferase (PAPS reductase)/FAD synthetase
MKFALFTLSAIYGIGCSSAFTSSSSAPRAVVRYSSDSYLSVVADNAIQFDQEQFIQESKDMRLKHLEEQAMYALKILCKNYGNAVFPNATMIAGDVIITHLLHAMGYLKDGKCKIMVVNTFHPRLFPETIEFLKEIEEFYDSKAEVFCAEGIPVGEKAAYILQYGANLWKENIEEYDCVCKKVEPFQHGLKTLNTNCMHDQEWSNSMARI